MLLDGGDEATLTVRDYEQLRRGARTYRQELVVRLAGEAGLRPSEMTAVTPGHVVERPVAGSRYPFLDVPETGERGRSRAVFLRDDLDAAIERYAAGNDIADDEPLLDVSTRRIQMLVAEVGERAAADTGRDVLTSASPSDLRDVYARRLIRSEGVNPRVVKDQGGWSSLDSLAAHFDPPSTEAIVAELDGGSPSPSRTHRVVESVTEVAAALPSAGDRDAVEQTTVDRLAATSAFEYAWIGDGVLDRPNGLRAVAGIDPPSVAARLERYEESGAFQRAVETGAVQVVPGERNAGSVAAVPLCIDSTDYGVLAAASDRPDAFGPTERKVLAVLGTQVAFAVTAVERKRLLLADTVVELEFRITDDAAFFAAASDELACTFELQGLVPADDGALLHYVAYDGSDLDRLLELAADAPGIADVRLVRDYSEGSVLEVVVSEGTPSTVLVDESGTVQRLVAEDGVLELTAEFAPEVDLRAVVEQVGDRFPSADLMAKREVEHGVRTAGEYRETLEDQLTEKQRTVLRAAYHADYFAWPRGATAEELADSMGVSSPTLHNHLRKGQQKLLDAFIENEGATYSDP